MQMAVDGLPIFFFSVCLQGVASSPLSHWLMLVSSSKRGSSTYCEFLSFSFNFLQKYDYYLKRQWKSG